MTRAPALTLARPVAPAKRQPTPPADTPFTGAEVEEILSQAHMVDHRPLPEPTDRNEGRSPGGPLVTDYRIQRLDEVPTEAPPPLLIDRIDPEGHTILFGAGGVGKGSLASEWIRRLLIEDEHTILILDFEDHPAEWGRRVASLGANTEAVHIVHGLQKSLMDLADSLANEAQRIGASLVIIGSTVAASGLDPLKPDAAAAYAKAIKAFHRPVLSLAHVTKAEDHKFPFGSIYWHNFARVTRSLSKDTSGLVLAQRKSNNYALQRQQTVSMTWRDGHLREVWERDRTETIGDMAMRVLEANPTGLKTKVITTMINENRDDAEGEVKTNAVNMALKRRSETGLVVRQGELWILPDSD